MDLLNISETLKTCWPVPLLALAITFAGHTWINYLYPKALQRDSLSPGTNFTTCKMEKTFVIHFSFALFWQSMEPFNSAGTALYYRCHQPFAFHDDYRF